MDTYSEKKLKRDLKTLRIFERLSNSCQVEVKPEIIKGTVVEITSGSFRGIEGIVESRKNHSFLIVNIDMLGQSVKTEIKAEHLETAY